MEFWIQNYKTSRKDTSKKLSAPKLNDKILGVIQKAWYMKERIIICTLLKLKSSFCKNMV